PARREQVRRLAERLAELPRIQVQLEVDGAQHAALEAVAVRRDRRHGGAWSGSAMTPIAADGYRFERCVLGAVDLELDLDPGQFRQALGEAPHLLAPGWDGLWDIRCADLATLLVQVLDAETDKPIPGAT